MSDGTPFDAATLMGLLADEDRRRVVAALVLGATTLAEISDRADIDLSRSVKAVGRLMDADLVVQTDRGKLVLLAEAFQQAARAAAGSRAPTPESV